MDQFNREARLLEKFCAFVTAPQGSTLPLEARQDLFPSLEEYEDLLKNEQVPPIARPTPGRPIPLHGSLSKQEPLRCFVALEYN